MIRAGVKRNEIMKRASFGARLAALAIDAAGVTATAFIFGNLLLKITSLIGLVQFVSIDTNAQATALIIFTLWEAAWVYMLSDVVAGGTPGKWLLGLKIRKEDGGRAGFGRRLVRYALKCSVLLIVVPFGTMGNTVLSILFFAIGLAGIPGYLLILGKDRQALYDRLSHTAVFRRA
jgi:uncharacterized RDD family membrane protein YckC